MPFCRAGNGKTRAALLNLFPIGDLAMFAIKLTNLENDRVRYIKTDRPWEVVCEIKRIVIDELECDGWYDDDVRVEIVELDDDFDYENQPDFN